MNQETNPQRNCTRKQQIIEAAKACFSEYGFHGCSMAELFSRSGYGAGQLYRDFHSKEALINEVVKSVAAEWRAFLFRQLRPDTTLSDLLNIESAFWSGWSQREHALLLESYSEASRNEQVRKILTDEEEQTINYLAGNSEILNGETQQPFSRAQIRLLLTIIDGFICRVVYDQQLNENELVRLNTLIFGNQPNA
ncbi:TetR/AcrR family transcriptional regulator [Kosakonia oryzae]|uniref:TetR/AcrR family transcriptional regulator n=1 Tax=Kosakonia oryzae TaxID=497725 RepID=UPI001D08F741|nr:TetR/AcrR family transcriptional regulator [Kosakonia oryzae]UDJ83490.1 TetR/AcrR family transcriptional regulator [Kosakonia oryzae]